MLNSSFTLETEVGGVAVIASKVSVHGWSSKELHIRTEVVATFLAVGASSTGHSRFESNAIT